ncbi:UDP-N-acetylmuramoyl-L-alanyl-D-glutamate--2,6-diaminopimelate ligase [Marinomonas balearica]|uniref:UDP-N-acetylmuramoyl-L-alanyl-D-glutamate--2,6-diaminopimelate ligase n=1 Tax=Marinomonas balearica TaxID=491947 RepID=A0A4R6MBZ6_9GAMM|nr:UDP-N-acetylmuramoyl-L-alanyl-D-glutamate--2,6-diaminopimelate ligase [Marinomonas balearica]TDO99043.1 UDP-N-acetylmuramoylalanyl-D-glutamate--2,6-diaminopimelate ligase [Marinomonas balearica]
MFQLSEFERFLSLDGRFEDLNYPLTNVETDSRKVSSETLFVALPGVESNGWDYLDAVEKQGCKYAIVPSNVGKEIFQNRNGSLNVIASDNVYAFLKALVEQSIGKAPRHLIAVTGTNGKSSICFYVAQLADAIGLTSAIIGTFGVGKLNSLREAKQTTPDLLTLQKTLARFEKECVDLVAFEVSSHALDQNRVNGVAINTAIFSNLSQDHLDYHGSMENYAEAKRKLFRLPSVARAIFCSQSDYYNFMSEKANGERLYYGERSEDDFAISNVVYHAAGCTFTLSVAEAHYEVELPLMGEFNVENAVGALASVWPLTENKLALISALNELKGAPGRMEKVLLESTAKTPVVLVDYAHTPDALSVALKALSVHSNAPVTCVFGCGGDRDKGKRSQMMQAAFENADKIILTTDNPRTESPDDIIQDALKGISEIERQKVIVDKDRRNAIEHAILSASSNEIVLIAGKGHETYQDVNGVKYHFDDKEEALSALKKYA